MPFSNFILRSRKAKIKLHFFLQFIPDILNEKHFFDYTFLFSFLKKHLKKELVKQSFEGLMNEGRGWNSRSPVELGPSKTLLWKSTGYWECWKYQKTQESTEEIFTTCLWAIILLCTNLEMWPVVGLWLKSANKGFRRAQQVLAIIL